MVVGQLAVVAVAAVFSRASMAIVVLHKTARFLQQDWMKKALQELPVALLQT